MAEHALLTFHGLSELTGDETDSPIIVRIDRKTKQITGIVRKGQTLLDIRNRPLMDYLVLIMDVYLNILSTIRNDPQISGDEGALMEGKADTLFDGILQIRSIEDKGIQKSIMMAMIAAMYIGSHQVSGMLPNIIANLMKAHTEKARSARRQNAIQEIIERRAAEHWQRYPSYNGNKEGTAKKICAKVVADIKALPKPPKGWLLTIPGEIQHEDKGKLTKEQEKKLVAQISKRIARIS
jgi:hypothetical protein